MLTDGSAGAVERGAKRSWLSRIALVFGLLFVLLLGAVVWAVSADHQYLKDDLESFLSETLQREFRISGPLQLRVGRHIEVSADEIVLGALPENVHPELVSIRHFAAVIDTASLLFDTIVVESLVIEGVDVRLEQDAEGVANWELFPAEDDASSELDSDGPIPVMFRKVDVSAAQVSLRSAELADSLAMNISSLSESVDDNDVIHLLVSGDIGGTDFSGSASVESWTSLLAQREVSVAVDAALGEVQFSGDISLADLRDPSRPVADIRLSGPNVEYLTDIFEMERISSGPLDLDFSIQPAGALMRFDLNGAIGEFDVDSEGTFDDLSNPQDVKVEFSATGANAGAIFEAVGIDGLPSEAFALSTVVRKQGDSLNLEKVTANIGSTKFNATAQLDQFPNLGGAVLVLHSSGPDIAHFAALSGLPSNVHSEFAASVELQSDSSGGTTATANVEIFDIRVVLNGMVSDDPLLHGSVADLHLSAPNTSKLAAIAGLTDLPDSKADLKVRIERIDGGLELHGGVLKLNNDDLNFAGRISDELMSSSTTLKLDLALGDVRDTLRAFAIDIENVPSGAMKASAQVTAAPDMLHLTDTQIEYADSTLQIGGEIGDLSGALSAELKVDLAGARLQKLLEPLGVKEADDRPYRIASKIILDSDSVALKNVVASVSGLMLQGDIAFDRNRPADDVDIQMQASSADVFSFAKTLGGITGPADTTLDLNIIAQIADGEYRVDRLEVDIGDSNITANGRVGAAPDFTNSRLSVNVDIPDAGNLAEMFGFDFPSESVGSSFQVRNEGAALRIDDFVADIGDSAMKGQLLYIDQGLPHIEVDLKASRLDLRSFLSDEEDEPEEAAPSSNSGKVIPDIAIPYEMLGHISTQVQLSIDEFTLSNGSVYTDVVLAADITDGALHVRELQMLGEEDSLFNARLGVEPSVNGGSIWARLNAKSIDIGLPAETDEERQALPRYDLAVAVIGSGATTRELVTSANGYAKIVSGAGRINTGALSIFSQDFLYELLNTLNPFLKSDPNTNIKCSAILATVEDGQVVGNPAFVLQSERVKIIADVKVDLATEALDADFNTIAQKGLGLSLGDLVNPYVRVGGTIGRPGLSFDRKTALFEGGAAVATGGVSILALNFKNRFMTGKDPCGKAVEDASRHFADLELKYGNADSAEEILEAGKRK